MRGRIHIHAGDKSGRLGANGSLAVPDSVRGPSLRSNAPPWVPNEDAGSDEVRKRIRTIENRLAAKRSREQARSRVDELERGYSLLAAQNEALARRLAQVEMKNVTLRRGRSSSPNSHTSSPKSTGNGQEENNNIKHRVGDSAAGRGAPLPILSLSGFTAPSLRSNAPPWVPTQ